MTPELTRYSDAELLVTTAEASEAFGWFYDRHARVVAGYLLRLTGDREVALDLTAEVFAAALAASARYRQGAMSGEAWLIGIARSKLRAIRLGNARADADRRRLGIPRLGFDDAALDRVEEVLDARLADGLRGLSVDQREAIVARVIEERDYDDVTRTAGTSEASADPHGAIRAELVAAAARRVRPHRPRLGRSRWWPWWRDS